MDNDELKEDAVPTIAVCGSGGGIRAMYETLGWMLGADSLGIVDTIQYASGLSGSTWLLNPWVASELSLPEYKEHIIPRLELPLTEQIKALTIQDTYDLLIVLGRTYYDKQELSPIDLYGALLSHILLKKLDTINNPYQATLSSLQPQIEDGRYPFILSTSVLGANTIVMDTFDHKPTYEFSPYTSGCFEVKSFVPTWALGRPFNQGTSQAITPRSLFPELSALEKAAAHLVPGYVGRIKEIYTIIKALEDSKYYGHEVPLGTLMGICGSAFSTDIYNALLELYQILFPGPINPHYQKPLEVILTVLQNLLEDTLGALGEKLSLGKLSQEQIKTYLQNHEFASAQIPNLSYKQSDDAFDSLAKITLVDGAYELIGLDRVNIGIVPLLNRKVDVIFIADSSEDMRGAPSLRASEELARKLNLPFPKVSYEQIGERYATLIVDEDNQDTPIIVYMPGIKNPAYDTQVGHPVDPEGPDYGTLTFDYPRDKAEDLMGLIEYNVLSSKETLLEALHLAVSRKQPI